MIQIKKKITLEFLGDEYTESYLEFNSIAMKDYDKLIKDSKAFEEKPEDSYKFIYGFLTERFVSGKFPQEGELKDVSKDDLQDFPSEVFLRAFQSLTGQLDPKV